MQQLTLAARVVHVQCLMLMDEYAWPLLPCPALQTYAKGRVALVGDAAHMMTPTLAQGCSQALEDALELGRAIGCLGLTPAALAEYEQIRLPMASPVQAASVQVRSGSVAAQQPTNGCLSLC